MTGTQCNSCLRMQTEDENLRPRINRLIWISISRRGLLDNLDFCCKKCLLEYVNVNFEDYPIVT